MTYLISPYEKAPNGDGFVCPTQWRCKEWKWLEGGMLYIAGSDFETFINPHSFAFIDITEDPE